MSILPFTVLVFPVPIVAFVVRRRAEAERHVRFALICATAVPVVYVAGKAAGGMPSLPWFVLGPLLVLLGGTIFLSACAAAIAAGLNNTHLDFGRQEHASPGHRALWVISGSVLLAVYTALLLKALGFNPAADVDLSHGAKPIIAAFLVQLATSAAESICYQGCIQLWLTHALRRVARGSWYALILTAFVFTSQHVAGQYTYIRYVMVFPAALMFGITCRRYGLWVTIALHCTATFINMTLLTR